MKKILVVVDMQEEFDASNNSKLIRGISNLCERWSGPIIILEYRGFGKTHIDIVNACRNNHTTLTKNNDDGSRVIKKHLIKKNLISNKIKFYVCGVNSEYCVKDTAFGLSEFENSTVNIIKPLCNSLSSYKRSLSWLNKNIDINGIKTIPRIRNKNEKIRKLVGC